MPNAIPTSLLKDRYWASVIYLFTNNQKLKTALTMKYFDLEHGEIRIKTLKRDAAVWSHSEKIMLHLALHLFNERNKFNLSDIDFLDDFNKELAFKAMTIRFRA